MVVTNNVFYRSQRLAHSNGSGLLRTTNNTFYGSNMYPGKLGAMTLGCELERHRPQQHLYDPSAMRSLDLVDVGVCYIDNNIVYKPSGAGDGFDAVQLRPIQQARRRCATGQLSSNYDFT